MEIISRSEAKAKGLMLYFTGKPCHRGHVVERYVSAKACYICSEQNAKAWAAANRERQSVTSRQRNYGLPQSHLTQILSNQCGRCAICGKSVSFDIVPGKNTTACVDHDHAGGGLRGILCHSCNTGLGRLGDNIAGLQRALAYLERAEQLRP